MVLFRLGLISLFAAVMLWPITASAQTFVCPSGPGPGERQVGTTGGSGGVAVIPICASDGSEDEPEQEQADVWEERWGAVATGGNGFGAITDMRSERQAALAALDRCKANATDGSKCKALTYYNQCAVVAWGKTGYIFQRGPDLKIASAQGMQKCRGQYEECEIYYSGCSYPLRVN